MIDFRYHLVSLVSVFLALAVGIVLGAGPLKESIGTTLTEQVRSLAQEKDTLRTDRDNTLTALGHRDEFISTVAPSLIGGQLTGRSVAIVTLPGVSNDDVQPLLEAITTAGGQVTARIAISNAWVDPQQAATRTKVLTDLADATGTTDTEDAVDTRLAKLLATAIVTAGGATGQSTDAQKKALDAMRSADLISTKGTVAGPAASALVLAPAVQVATSGQPVTPPDPNAVAEFVRLVSVLDDVGGGTVVTGPATSATSGGVIDAIRKDGGTKARVSTVDTGQQPAGVITAVLALREQLAGESGAYGFGSGVGDPLPALAAVAPGSGK